MFRKYQRSLPDLTSERLQRTVGNWRVCRSWRRRLPLRPPPSALLPASLQPGWDRPLSELEKRGCFPVSLLRLNPAPLPAASPWFCGLKEPLGLSLRPPCFSPGQPQKVSWASFPSPGGDGVSPGCAEPEKVAVTRALCTTQNPRFCHFLVGILKLLPYDSLKFGNRCSVHDIYSIF